MSKRPSLKFAVQDLRENEGLSAEYSLGPERLFKQTDAGTRLAGAVSVSLEFSLAGSEILLRARIRGNWAAPCSRCLKEAESPLETRLEESFPASAESIDAEPALREAVLLELPQRIVCPKDCGGFKSRWGDDQDSFPEKKSPFDVLKKLKKSDH